MKLPLLIFCASLAFAGQTDWQKRLQEANGLDHEGRYGEAQEIYVAALAEAESSGDAGARLAQTLNNLAAHHFLCGNYAQTEPLYRRALEAWKTAGQEFAHDLALTMKNLGSLYRTLGRYAEAEPLYAAALPMLER